MDRWYYIQRAQRRCVREEKSYKEALRDAYNAAVRSRDDQEVQRVLAEGRSSFYGAQSQMERIFREAEEEAFQEQLEADYLEEIEED